MAGSILGTRVLRTEDPELLVGAGRFVDDLQLDHPLHVVFVRSEMAHALLLSVDTSAALTMPGVVTVLTAAELELLKAQTVNDHGGKLDLTPYLTPNER